MTTSVEFLFDFGSPYTFLAYHGLRRVCVRQGAEIIWRPMLLGGVFQATGNHSPMEVPAKARWSQFDLARWAGYWEVPFRHNPHFPINTLTLMRGAVGYQDRGERFADYVDAVFRAMWQEGEDLGDRAVLARILSAHGFDASAFTAMVGEQAVKDRLKQVTEEAVARGVFGAPTFFVGRDMYWGQDRLPLIEVALGRARA